MAVCDGHGVEGHQVSGFIKRTLPKDLSNALVNKEILTSDKNKSSKKNFVIFIILALFFIWLGWRIAEQINHFIWDVMVLDLEE